MNNRFREQIRRYQDELRRLHEEGQPLDYETMRALGLLKPVSFRLPVTTVVLLDEMVKWTPWSTKQEMLYEMINSAINDFLQTCPEPVREGLEEMARAALEEWLAEQRGDPGA